MSITLDGITLPTDLIWTDEYNWSPVRQSVRSGLTGALVIQEAAQQAGRPVTLAGGRDYAWVSKATLEALRAKLIQPDLDMTLDYHGEQYSVRFRQQDTPIDAQQVAGFANPQAYDRYVLTLRLMEV